MFLECSTVVFMSDTTLKLKLAAHFRMTSAILAVNNYALLMHRPHPHPGHASFLLLSSKQVACVCQDWRQLAHDVPTLAPGLVD